MDLGTLFLKLRADTAGVSQAFKGIQGSVQQLQGSMLGLGLAAGGALAGMVALGSKAVKAAGVVEDVASAAKVTYGELTDEVKKWASYEGKALGRSKHDLMGYAVGLQSLLDPMVGNREAAAEMSTTLAGLAVDLASFYPNTTDVEALTALKSAIAGETEGMKRFGVVLNEQALQQEAFRNGIMKPVSALTSAERALITYQLVMEKTKNAIGDATNTSGQWANSYKRVEAAVSDLQVEMGQRLMPVAETLLSWVMKSISWWGKLAPEVKQNVMNVAGLVAVVAGASAVFGLLVTALSPVISVLAGVGKAVLALALNGPFLALAAAVIGVISLVGALRIAWDANLGGIQDKWKDLLSTLTKDAQGLKDFVDWLDAKFSPTGRSKHSQAEAWRDAAAQIVDKDFARAKELMAIADRLEGKTEAGIGGAAKAAESAQLDLAGAFKESFAAGLGTFKEAFSGLGKSVDLGKMVGLKPGEGLGMGLFNKVGEAAGNALSSIMDALGLKLGGLGKIAVKAGDEVKVAAGSVKKALAEASGAADVWGTLLRGVASRVLDAFVGRLEILGPALQGFLENVKKAGGGDVWKGFAAGGAALESAGLSLLMDAIAALVANSKAFGFIAELLNKFFKELADALGGLIKPLAPVVSLLLQGLRVLLPLLQVLADLFGFQMKAMFYALFFVGKALNWMGALLKPVVEAIQRTLPTIDQLRQGLLMIGNATNEFLRTVIGVRNWILEQLASIIELFNKDWAAQLRGTKVDADAFIKALGEAARATALAAKAQFDEADAAWNATYAAYAAADANGKMADAAKSAYEGLANIPSGYKVALARFNATSDGDKPGTSAAAAKHARGGVVTRPTFALLGESGPEAVVPLRGSSSGSGLDGAGVGGTTITIKEVHLHGVEDPAAFLRKLRELIGRERLANLGTRVDGGLRFSGG